MVVKPMDTRLMGPYEASEVGRLKMPTPMMLPTMRAVAVVSPNPRDAAGSGPFEFPAEAAAPGVGLASAIDPPIMKGSAAASGSTSTHTARPRPRLRRDQPIA